jgi:hypothetical protein
MRQDIVYIVNKLAKESGSLDFELKKAYQIIFNTMKETQKHISKMNIQMNNGCIFIDGKLKGRVVPLLKPFCKEDPVADYYENRIYQRQENYSL